MLQERNNYKKSFFFNAKLFLQSETIDQKGYWRILRYQTLIDLICAEVKDYLTQPTEINIKRIIAYSAMLQYNLKLGAYDPDLYQKRGFSNNDITNAVITCNSLIDEFEKRIDRKTAIHLYSEYAYLLQLKTYYSSSAISRTIENIIQSIVEIQGN